MQALFLEDVKTFRLREVPTPVPGDNEVLVRVCAAGICGTDLHIFQGRANHHVDERGQPIPLRQQPQVLGHEFCGRVAAVGRNVKKVRAGDAVVVDQVLNCRSLGREPWCEYCETGDSHQCAFGDEFGVSGLPGAFRDYVAVPGTNLVPLPSEMPFEQAALIEPLGCVLHASDRMEQARNRYTFEGQRRIRYVLIVGAGPSGLFFVQYLRNVRRFDGELFVADLREGRLALAGQLGGTPLDVSRVDLITEIRARTHGDRVHYLIEASGSAEVFDWIPAVVRHQATVLMYGAGHSGRELGCLMPLQSLENVLVTSAGASGGFDPDGAPTTYRLGMEYIRDGKINAEALVSHRYTELGQLQRAFSEDVAKEDFIKGVLLRPEST